MKFTKTIKKTAALALALFMTVSAPLVASAAPIAEATIDTTKKGSIELYKYDLTNAEKDGVWDSSYVSTGVLDQSVIDTLTQKRAGDNDATSDLGNGQTSTGYAIKGVEFSYVKIADIVQFSESAVNNTTYDRVEVLYAINKTAGADFLKALGLSNGANRYEAADSLDSNSFFYESNVLNDALAAALTANSTTLKNALETYMASTSLTKGAMPETDDKGYSKVQNLDLGLYLMVETKVPEMVTSTVDPFLVSLPMTSVNGGNASDGGTRWIYDVTLFPKNLTGIPSLEKTLREAKADTGKHNGTTNDITDGYAHTGTASAGDVIDYQIISTLPSITSASTYLTKYGFVDTLSAGLTYNKNDVKLEFFSDEACTAANLLATWTESDGKFTVTYGSGTGADSVMTIDMTAAGLTEINTNKKVYTQDSMVNSGYSDCTVRITYTATVDSDTTTVFGDSGNPNQVVMTWQRTNSSYLDTLVDDAHVYTYGIELTKLFSDNKGNFANVEFIIHNDTDNYFVKAELNTAEGVYYMTDHVDAEADATHFIPVDSNGNPGKVIIKGLEDDTYTITEVRTDNGYTLLKEDIEVVISQVESETLCDVYTVADVKGLLQNDPRYAEIINSGVTLENIPQKHLEHKLLTASATVDANAVTMLADDDSVNAMAPLSVVNTPGFKLPQTGDNGTWMFGVFGVALMAVAAGIVVTATRKKEEEA